MSLVRLNKYRISVHSNLATLKIKLSGSQIFFKTELHFFEKILSRKQITFKMHSRKIEYSIVGITLTSYQAPNMKTSRRWHYGDHAKSRAKS